MGGRKSRIGPILGAAIVVYLPNLLADIGQFRVVAGGIAGVAVLAGGAHMLRHPETRRATAVPVALCIAFFVFSLLLNRITDYKLTVFGLMILFVVYYLPDGIYGFLRKIISEVRPGWVHAHAVIQAIGDDAHVWSLTPPTSRTGRPLLEVRQVVMQFGGPEGARPRRSIRDARHHPRPDRAQRIGQIHHDERAHRHLRGRPPAT